MSEVKIMKAVELDKTSAAFRKKYPTAQDLYNAGWILQPKFDGCYGMAIIVADRLSCTLRSRTGEDYTTSCRHILDALWTHIPPTELPAVIIGEVWHPEKKFPEISGLFRQQRAVAKDLIFMAHDWLRGGLNANGELPNDPRRYDDRLAPLEQLLKRFEAWVPSLLVPISSWHTAHGGVDVQGFARSLKTGGQYDGAILKDPSAPYTVGLARAGQIVKVKPTMSLDLRCVAVKLATGEKTGRDVWTIDVEYRGVITSVGSGVPHDKPHDLSPGRIVEIEAMGLTEDGKLREPRFKGVRYDTEVDE